MLAQCCQSSLDLLPATVIGYIVFCWLQVITKTNLWLSWVLYLHSLSTYLVEKPIVFPCPALTWKNRVIQEWLSYKYVDLFVILVSKSQRKARVSLNKRLIQSLMKSIKVLMRLADCWNQTKYPCFIPVLSQFQEEILTGHRKLYAVVSATGKL